MSAQALQTKSQTQTCKLRWKKIDIELEMASLSKVFAALDSASILGANKASRFNYWAAEPTDVFEFNTKDHRPFEKLQKVLNKYKLDTGGKFESIETIFTGGWIGYFSYELGRYIEKIPATTEDDLGMPLIKLCFYDKVICYDSAEKTCWLFVLELPDDCRGSEENFAELEKLISDSKEIRTNILSENQLPIDIDPSQFKTNISKDFSYFLWKTVNVCIFF